MKHLPCCGQGASETNLRSSHRGENLESEKVDTESENSLEPTENPENGIILGEANSEGLPVEENLGETVNVENGEVLDTESTEIEKVFD